jgi:hypothetical protein
VLALPPSPARVPCSHSQTGPPDSATSPVIVLYSRALCARLCVLSLAGFLMSAHLSRLRLFQRHLRSLVWVGVWVWDWIHSHTPLRTRSPSSRHPLFTHYPFPSCSLVCRVLNQRFVDGNGENRFGSEEPDRPLVPLTSTDHDVPYPAGCRRPGNPTCGPKPTSGSRAGEFCTVGYPPLRSSTAAAAVLAPCDSN